MSPLYAPADNPDLLSVAVWASLDDVAMSPLYAPAASAFARIVAHCQHGAPVPHRHSIPDGATQAIPVLTLPYAPSATPSAWPSQLALPGSIDTHVRRRVINAVHSTNPHHKSYLSTWVDQVDTTANADIPFNVRGLHYAKFDNPALVDLPFAPPMPTLTLPAPESPAPQVTAYRPMALRDIFMPGSIRKPADAARAIIGTLEFMQRGEAIPAGALPASPRAGRHRPGRSSALRSWHCLGYYLPLDGYYLPLDFPAPLLTHLHTLAYFGALGDDCSD